MQLNTAIAVDFYCDEFPAPLLLLVCFNVLRTERYSGDRMRGRGIAESDSNEPEMRSALAEVAVGTIIVHRPPHRSVRALVSAYGSYLGYMAAKRSSCFPHTRQTV
jgi:hypothetical protein